MQTGVPGLYAAGEAVGGANGANRLSGNAITEALVFGREAGRSAAAHAQRAALAGRGGQCGRDARRADRVRRARRETQHRGDAARICRRDAGQCRPVPHGAEAHRALAEIARMQDALGETPPGARGRFDMRRLDWFDLRNMLLVARSCRRSRARAAGKPRRAAARGFSRDLAELDGQPGRRARGRRHSHIAREDVRAAQAEPA